MEYVKLGNSDLRVSRICLGCMGFGDPTIGQHSWTIGEEPTREIIHRSLDLWSLCLQRTPELHQLAKVEFMTYYYPYKHRIVSPSLRPRVGSCPSRCQCPYMQRRCATHIGLSSQVSHISYSLCFLNISFIVSVSRGFIVGSFRSFTMCCVPCLYFWK